MKLLVKLLVGAVIALPRTSAAQQMPVDPVIARAAAQIGAISTPTMPLQTITIGNYDNATHRWGWLLSDYYPPSVPVNKRQSNGGNYPPEHRTNILSYNVRYQISISHATPDLKLVMTMPDGNGGTLSIPATIDATGTVYLPFHPVSNAAQSLRFTYTGGGTVAMVWPVLHAQLGAFVVPHLLISIVYEPPGALSSATYGAGSSDGSSYSWGRSYTNGLVSSVADTSVTNTLNRGGKGWSVAATERAESVWVAKAESLTAAVIDSLEPAVMAKATEILSGMMANNNTIQVTNTTTVDTTHGSGWHVAVSKEFGTSQHRYPGGDDRFIIMNDVLFVYLVNHGKVMLAPVAYTQTHGLTLDEMRQQLSPALVQEFAALDPLISGIDMPGASTTVATRQEGAARTIGIGLPSLKPAPRFTSMHQVLDCKSGSGWDGLDLSIENWQSVTAAAETTQTTITQQSGILNTVLAANVSNLTALSYHSSHEDISGDLTSTDVRVECAPGEGFEVPVYYDNIFRTFLAIKGGPLDATPRVEGRLLTRNGAPLVHQRVVLRDGVNAFVTTTGPDGRFEFRAPSIGRGSGVLSVGKTTHALNLRTSSIKGVELVVP